MNHRAICEGLAVAALVLAPQASAFGRCPPARDAELLAAGGAIVSGRIIEVDVPITNAGIPYFEWAGLQVTERRAGSAPDIIYLRASEAGLYTYHFAVGGTATLAIRRPFGESWVTICDARGP